MLLTRVFPFDVWQVGRAGVADGQTLLGHTLVTVHVHEVGRHRDLRGHGRRYEERITPHPPRTDANQHPRMSTMEGRGGEMGEAF